MSIEKPIPHLSIMLIILLMALNSFGKVGLTLSTHLVLDDNVFENYERREDVVYRPNLKIYGATSWDQLLIQLYYTGSVTSFEEYQDRFYHSHIIGGSGFFSFQNGQNLLSLDVQYGRRVNRQDYTLYDCTYHNGLIRFRNNRFLYGQVDLGFQIQGRDYFELTPYSFNENRGFIRKTFYLPSRTTLIGGFELGYKCYNDVIIEEVLIEDIVNYGNRDRGQGKNRGQGKGREDNEDLEEPLDDRNIQADIGGEKIYQWIGSLRVAQSLGSKIGVAVEGMIRRIPQGRGRYLIYQDSGYEEDDHLFDDPYAYESDEIESEITWLLPWKMVFKTGYGYQDRLYQYTIEVNEGNTQKQMIREDQKRIFWIVLRKTFPFQKTIKNIGIEVSFTNILNHSNDPFFHYNHHLTTLGWTITL